MPNIEDLLLPHIYRLKTYQGVAPSETLAEQAGIPLERVIRLNGNENPYGPSPRVAEALGNYRDYNHYPDPAQRNLRAALSDYLGVPDDNIVAGNGSDEIIDLLMRMFLAPDDEIIIPVPTFGMYSFSADVAGANAVSVPRDENFDIDIEAIQLAITPRTKAIFFPSPNNPTGNLVTEAQARALLNTGLLVVADEAYYDFCGQTLMHLLPEFRNLVVLRTFSKWAGLAGLRIGAGAMDTELAATMMGMKPPYNVNLAAEIALLASLADTSNLLDRVYRNRHRNVPACLTCCPTFPASSRGRRRQTLSCASCQMVEAWKFTKQCAGEVCSCVTLTTTCSATTSASAWANPKKRTR